MNISLALTENSKSTAHFIFEKIDLHDELFVNSLPPQLPSLGKNIDDALSLHRIDRVGRGYGQGHP